MPSRPESPPVVHTLANGVRSVVLPLPHLPTAAVSVFVRSGSQHETARQNGISHFVEHMAFKGTHTRDCQRINLDAERLGADVNAHTDKDHTAFHMQGLAEHAGPFVHMLADIVRHGSFPAAELERERQVILQEFAEDEDDALSTSFKLFDKLCYGDHPVARPVIGNRRNIERFSREEVLEYVQARYGARNVVVGVAGAVDPQAVLREVEAAFGDMPAGEPNEVPPPDYRGGLAVRRVPGYSQAHVVLGFPIPSLTEDHQAALLGAAVFGEGMSSPLLDEIRERRGLVYHAGCSADVAALCGQFVVEASMAPEHLDEFFVEVMRLLRAHAESVAPEALERARNQIVVRGLRAQERSAQRVEAAVQDLCAFGRVRSREELRDQLLTVDTEAVRQAFGRLLGAGASVAIAGKLPRGCEERVRARVGLR
ncbi:M16 family metallopeptidase [Piscinibacter sakaiensis]|nr:pitrilysin family protein [Piscinibacter sakaiensis]